jgi:hypothetical protein
MKKALSLILAISLALALCLVFTGCVETGTSSITYGEKYSYEKYVEDTFTVYPEGDEESEQTPVDYKIVTDIKVSITLNDDNSGKYEYYEEYTNEADTEESYIISGTANFEWVETSNGAITLFETKKTYDKKSFTGMTFDLPEGALFYSEDMVYFDTDSSIKFIREDSDLYETVYGTDEVEE